MKRLNVERAVAAVTAAAVLVETVVRLLQALATLRTRRECKG
jgi:hypothetical protein